MAEALFEDGADRALATYENTRERVGFFTDTTLCIGCKVCEVACKGWNELPDDGLNFTAQSYDNTSQLGGGTWRHVAFIEQFAAASQNDTATHDIPVQFDQTAGRWLMESDVCKHCTSAACLDVCPTGALFHTEFGIVVVQEDVCNGCGYCIPACPFGVIGDQNKTGHAAKCTLFYDRLKADETPACAKACPTELIQFGVLDDLRERAAHRLEKVRHDFTHVQLYGEDPNDGVGGFGAFFLLLDKPEVYGLLPDSVVTTRDLPQMWRSCGYAAVALGSLVLASAFAGRR